MTTPYLVSLTIILLSLTLVSVQQEYQLLLNESSFLGVCRIGRIGRSGTRWLVDGWPSATNADRACTSCPTSVDLTVLDVAAGAGQTPTGNRTHGPGRHANHQISLTLTAQVCHLLILLTNLDDRYACEGKHEKASIKDLLIHSNVQFTNSCLISLKG